MAVETIYPPRYRGKVEPDIIKGKKHMEIQGVVVKKTKNGETVVAWLPINKEGNNP